MSSRDQDAAVDEILARFPGPVTILASRFRLLVMLVIASALLSLVVVLMLQPIGLRSKNFDGFIVAAILLLWIAGLLRIFLTNIPVLILDGKGVTSNPIVGWRQIAEWKEVEFCKLDDRPPANVLIGARDRSPKRWSDHKLIKVSWCVEINDDPLVRLLTVWRERALQAKG